MTSPIAPVKQTIYYAIIVAGGSGTRMQSQVPKQFLLLNGEPVLMHTIKAFRQSAHQPEIIVVLHSGFHAYWAKLCLEYNFNLPHKIIAGGETRFHSVKKGIDGIADDENAVVAVHDAVRPLTSKQIIDEAYEQAAKQGNAIAAVKSRDSVRLLTGESTESLLRESVYLMQTPQTFQLAQIKQAYRQPYTTTFTDDASVAEKAGFKIHLVEGSYQNIKITYPEDIAIAEAILSKTNKTS